MNTLVLPWQQVIYSNKREAFVLKKLVADSSKCSGCGGCEATCSMNRYKVEDREKSAIRISSDGQGGFRITVCDQCGTCMVMCSVMALRKTRSGVVLLDSKSCVGCLICVGECPQDTMRYHDDLPAPFKCIACGLCAKQCPSGALRIVTDSSKGVVQ